MAPKSEIPQANVNMHGTLPPARAVEQVPPEIWRKIFIIYCERGMCAVHAVDLGNVCNRWRHIVCGISALWVDPLVGERYGATIGSPWVLVRSVTYSAGKPLRVTAALEGDGPFYVQDIWDIFEQHMGRVERMALQVESEQTNDEGEGICSREMVLAVCDDLPETGLRYLSLGNVFLEKPGHLRRLLERSRGLENLSVTYDERYAGSVLDKRGRIRRSKRASDISLPSLATAAFDVCTLASLTLGGFSTPQLKELTVISASRNSLLANIDWRFAESVQSLTLWGLFPDVEVDIIISDLPNLRTLTLEHCGVTDDLLEALCDTEEDILVPALRVLDIHNAFITGPGARQFLRQWDTRAVETAKNIFLRLRSCPCVSEGDGDELNSSGRGQFEPWNPENRRTFKDLARAIGIPLPSRRKPDDPPQAEQS